MKKLFTLIASALFAVGASAQTWSATTTAPEAGATLVDNELVEVKTVYSTTAKSGSVTIGDFSFDAYIQVRTGSAPSADNPTGSEQSGSTPLVITAKKNADVTLYYRRQQDSNSGLYEINDGKDMACFGQNDAKFEVIEETYKLYDTDRDDYKYAEKTFRLAEGGTYTIYRNGSTMNFYGFNVAEGTLADEGNTGGGEDDNTGSDDGNDNGNTGGDEGDNAGGSEGEGELIASWYFNNWSEATVAALKADAAAGYDTGWSDIEKKDVTEPTETSKDNCFWAADASVINEAGELVANNGVIDELKGLKFETVGNRALAIAVNYPTAQISSVDQTYKGGSYLWLGGKETDYFTILGVPAGSVITIGVESHNNTDARGITLSNTAANPAAPTTYEEQVWKVPAGDAAVDVVVTNTNGCHLYFIEIAEGTADDEPGEGDGNGDGDTTGIQQVAAKSGNSVIINLAGQKVDSSYKGIVIKDGKKYVQK